MGQFSTFLRGSLLPGTVVIYCLCFQILYNGQTVEVDGLSMKKLINDLQPDTNYSFVLTNRGSSAGGLQHRVFIRTAPDVLQSKPVATHKFISNGQFTLTLPKVQTSVPVRYILPTSVILLAFIVFFQQRTAR